MSVLRLIHSLRQRKGRGILVWAESVEAFAALAPALRAFGKRFPRANVYLFGPPPVMDALPGSGLPGIPVPQTYRSKMVLNWIFKQSKARVLLVAWPSADSELAVSVARDRAIPVILCQWSGRESEETAGALVGDWPKPPSLGFVWDAAAAAALQRFGTPADSVFVVEGGESLSENAATQIVNHLEPLVGGNEEVKLLNRRLATIGRWLSDSQDSPTWGWLVSRKCRSVPSVTALRSRLGEPETIICLGNGPSSEDSRLESIDHDAVFRVNHMWAKRGFLDKPEVVFTGSIGTLERVRHRTIFAFQTREAEQRILPKSLLLPRRTEYFVAEVLRTMDFEFYGNYKPTNGAVMLATAIALRPKRLVIAGIDLFQHPAGAYPSDTSTPNAYTIGHDEEVETQFILSLLVNYPGELTILSEVLERKWQEALHRSTETRRTGEAARSQA